MIKKLLPLFLLITFFSLTSCVVGPNYKRPYVYTPAKFKEAPKGWKIANPQAAFHHGRWWKIFHDRKLNQLEEKLICQNQTIATAVANYDQALAQIDQAAANYYPTVTATASITRRGGTGGGGGTFTSTSSQTGVSPGSSTTSTGSFSGGGGAGTTTTVHSIGLSASWEPDIWGQARRTVEAARGGAMASASLLAATGLASQASLAQFYFQVRALDRDQQILNATVRNYQRALQLTKNRYKSGVAGQSDVVLARTQLETATSLAINNKIQRGQLEHAIAVLIGRPPANFRLLPNPLNISPPKIPGSVPSSLLERRPDIAQAENLMIQANANIGVAISAYFPTLTINGNASYSGVSNLASFPNFGWSIGPQLAETIFDGGLRRATIAAARAGYRSTVASYRQTILAAFQDVEDNLISLRTLRKQAVVANMAARDAKLSAQLVLNQYKAGTVDYSAVITAQITAFNAQKTAADLVGLQMTSAVGLVKALGGGWNGWVCTAIKPCDN